MAKNDSFLLRERDFICRNSWTKRYAERISGVGGLKQDWQCLHGPVGVYENLWFAISLRALYVDTIF